MPERTPGQELDKEQQQQPSDRPVEQKHIDHERIDRGHKLDRMQKQLRQMEHDRGR